MGGEHPKNAQDPEFLSQRWGVLGDRREGTSTDVEESKQNYVLRWMGYGGFPCLFPGLPFFLPTLDSAVLGVKPCSWCSRQLPSASWSCTTEDRL